MTRFSEPAMIVSGLRSARALTFHRDVLWQEGYGRGEVLACNNYVYPGTERTVGTNGPTMMPEEIVAPCGLTLYRRLIEADRRKAAIGGIDIIRPARMVAQGTAIARGHAERMATPCKRCYPKETA